MADVRPPEEEEEEEESRAERAREFRKTLNRSRPSRKRYSLSSQFRQQSAFETSGRFEASVTASYAAGISEPSVTSSLTGNPFLTSVSTTADEGGDVSLASFGERGEPIYRELQELDSLSKFRNGMKAFFPQPVRNALLPPRKWKEWQKFFLVHLPILHWLWTYRPKQLIGDLVAGITIGVTHIPQGQFVYTEYTHTCMTVSRDGMP